MKKLLALVLSAASCAAFAAWEKIGSVEIAGTEHVSAALAQGAALTGNEMLGGVLSGAYMQSEAVQYFGPTRKGHGVLLPLYVDGALLAAHPERALDGVEFAILYPVVATKAKFLAHHADAVETNGYIVLDKAFVKFSADGLWAAYSDKKTQVDLALAEIATPRRAMGEDLARINVDAKGMDAIRRTVEELAKSPTNHVSREALEVVRSLVDGSVSMRIGPRGLDFSSSLRTKRGTELGKVGLKTLGPGSLAFAGRDALVACASAPDVGEADPALVFGRVLAIVRRHGLDMPFLSCVAKGACTAFTLDVAALAKYCRLPSTTNAFARIDVKRLAEDVKSVTETNAPFRAACPARQATFAIRGAEMKYTPAERFAATLPDVPTNRLCKATVTSLLSFFRALVPELLKLAPEDQAASVSPLLMLLPPEAKGGMATALWRDGDELKGVLRLSADEFRGLAVAVTAVATYLGAKDKAENGSDGEDDADVDVEVEEGEDAD